MTTNFVPAALKIQEMLEIDGNGLKMVMRFAKMYDEEKLRQIVDMAKSYPWRYKSPLPAFMKAVKEVNNREKLGITHTH